MNRTQRHNTDVLRKLFQLKVPLYPWKGIVIHHTASEYSSLRSIDAYHRRKFKDPLGIEYHFLIGNGRKAPDGWLDVARWQHQQLAIHLFKPGGAPDAIAISLVGNFEKRRPSRPQLATLIALLRLLQTGLRISQKAITTHRRVDGRLTQCPGKLFPFEWLHNQLR